jgi:GDP-L-fucose synthase
MKKILILGGFGFLGKNLNEVFKNSGYKIYNESRKTNCDLTSYDSLYKKIKKIKPDIIINSAAHVGGVGYVSENCAEVCSDNIIMYLNLFKVIKELNPKILLINPLANCSYPGDSLDILEESKWWDGIVHESVESYGNSKKTGYILSECYRKQYGIKTINLIIPNAYGPFDSLDENMTHAMNGIIIRLLKSIKNNKKVFFIWGSGKPIREWIYMGDVAKIIKNIVDKNITDLPNPINLGQNYGLSIKDSVNMIQNILGTNLELRNDLTKKEGAPKKVMCDKLFKENFPDFKFTEPRTGIKNTIKFYKNYYG